MQKRPDLVFVLVLIFGLGVVFTGVNANQSKPVVLPNAGQMPGVISEANLPR